MAGHRDARQVQHTEAGPMWYTVHCTFTLRRTSYRAQVEIRQPVTDAKIQRALAQQGLKMGAHETSNWGGLLIGVRRVVGRYYIDRQSMRRRR